MKNQRHDAILKLISQYDIDTQEELVTRLCEAGFNVTQATVSRDIRTLHLYKATGSDGKLKYIVDNRQDHTLDSKYKRVLKDGFVSIDMAQNILVIKTVSGMAMAVAAAVDSMKFSEIVGTIAGDDTIMMAVRTVEDTRICMAKIKELINS
ncbi:MAG: arginine repressor [Lachnospiraceae bacterium]|nr:arginine repressor [Lachnospiraceae bacterium]MBO7600411.1 arginine repressor [Lachnospiraceae bacterium]